MSLPGTEQRRPMTRHHPLFVRLVKAGTTAHVALYRILRGNIPHPLLGRHCILVTTTGRRSGRRHTMPLLFVRDGGDYVVVGSWGGSDSAPHWYRNLRADPRVMVEDRGRTTPAVAIEVDDAQEYARLWARLAAIYPAYETYRKQTSRRLPIVRLSPTGEQHHVR